MKTIDEAICHCREVAEEKKCEAHKAPPIGGLALEHEKACLKCAEEHEQLAEWLEELKESREWRTPKKPTLYGDYFGDYGTYIPTDWECPSCGAIYDYEDERYGFCPNCGKKIDWSVEE